MNHLAQNTKNIKGNLYTIKGLLYSFLLYILACFPGHAQTGAFGLTTEQLTSGDKHHFFGYIGQCQTIPWNASGQYILGLEIETIDRMPLPEEAATVFVIDTKDKNKIIRLDKTKALNPQPYISSSLGVTPS